MRLATLLIVQFSVVGWNNARAQCPDGSPPPCRSGLARGHVTIDSDAVAILPFRVRGPPGEVEWLREGIVDWLNIALDGLAGWRVVHPRTLLLRAPARAELMDIPAASRTAREVGAASLIVGSAFASGTQLRLHAELYDAVATRRLATVEARAPTADPAPGVDSLAVGLARQRLLSHRPTTRRSVEEYATTSPQALRAYLASEHLARQGAWQAAADSLLTAIGYDSTFGLAYYRLYIAGTFGAVPRGWQSPEIIRAALRHLDRLPQRQINGAARVPAVAVAQLGAELIEIFERLLGVMNFIAQIIGDTAEGVDVAEILSQPLRQEQRDDGEVFVMRLRQLACERFRRRRRVNPRKRLRNRGWNLAGTCRVQRGSWGVG